MAFKRVVLHKGDTVQLCFIPAGTEKTLAAFDEITHQRQKTSICIRTYTNGFPLCLDHLFLIECAPNGEHQIGLTSAVGDNLIGAFRFEPAAKKSDHKHAIDLPVVGVPGVGEQLSESRVIAFAKVEGYSFERVGNPASGGMLLLLSKLNEPIGMSFLLVDADNSLFQRVY